MAEPPYHYPPHFFQPVLPGFATSCSIPASFYKKYLEGKGCVRVELRSFRRRRTGWEVGMVGRRMVDGWREFAEEHHLKDGYFLVFKYDGKLGFDVSVFDKSEFEIEYQQLDEDEDDVMENEEKDEHEKLKMDFGHTRIDTEDRAEFPTSAKRRKAEDVPKFHTSACEIETPEIDKDEDADVEEDDEEPKTEFDCTGRRNKYSSSRVSTESFISTMKPSYLTYLYFPILFSEANKLNESCSITIKDDEGKLWPVKIRLKRENAVYTGAGWQSFVKGNDLREGDKFKIRIISKGKIPILSFHKDLPATVAQCSDFSDQTTLQGRLSIMETDDLVDSDMVEGKVTGELFEGGSVAALEQPGGPDCNQEETAHQQNAAPGKTTEGSLKPVHGPSALELLEITGTAHTESVEQLRCTDGMLSHEVSALFESPAAPEDEEKLDSTQEESSEMPNIGGMVIHQSAEQDVSPADPAQSVMLEVIPELADQTKSPERMTIEPSLEIRKSATTSTFECVPHETTMQEDGTERIDFSEEIVTGRVIEGSIMQDERLMELPEFRMHEEGKIEQPIHAELLAVEGNHVDRLEPEEISEEATVADVMTMVEPPKLIGDPAVSKLTKEREAIKNEEIVQLEVVEPSGSVSNPALTGQQQKLELEIDRLEDNPALVELQRMPETIQQEEMKQLEPMKTSESVGTLEDGKEMSNIIGIIQKEKIEQLEETEGKATEVSSEQVLLGLSEGFDVQEIGEISRPSEAKLPWSSELVGSLKTAEQQNGTKAMQVETIEEDAISVQITKGSAEQVEPLVATGHLETGRQQTTQDESSEQPPVEQAGSLSTMEPREVFDFIQMETVGEDETKAQTTEEPVQHAETSEAMKHLEVQQTTEVERKEQSERVEVNPPKFLLEEVRRPLPIGPQEEYHDTMEVENIEEDVIKAQVTEGEQVELSVALGCLERQQPTQDAEMAAENTEEDAVESQINEGPTEPIQYSVDMGCEERQHPTQDGSIEQPQGMEVNPPTIFVEQVEISSTVELQEVFDIVQVGPSEGVIKAQETDVSPQQVEKSVANEHLKRHQTTEVGIKEQSHIEELNLPKTSVVGGSPLAEGREGSETTQVANIEEDATRAEVTVGSAVEVSQVGASPPQSVLEQGESPAALELGTALMKKPMSQKQQFIGVESPFRSA